MAEQYLKKREEIDTRYQWKLADLFESDKLWEQEYDLVLELAEKMKKLQGTLGECASRLLEYFQLNDKLGFHFGRVYVYANESYHQDTQVAKYQAYSAKCDTLMAAVNSACAFASPEILEIPEDRLASFYKEEPELENYRRALEVICRDKAHTLSNEEESLLAAAGEMAVSPKNIFAMLNNADMKFPSIQGADGEEIPVTHGNYTTLLTNQDIHVREQAYKSLYSVYGKLGNTIAATFLAHLKQERFYAKARHFSSTRARHLNSGNIPENVYDNLIEAVHKHLPAMHRYISLRKKALGVELLHMYDLFVPLAGQTEKKYTIEEAELFVAEALAPMGEEYVSILKRGYTEGWIDVYENENKRSGAYSWGAYGTHPYVLLNYQENLESMFTLAHEMGHAMHTYYSNQNQPITYADYLIFVAEVASTCNEALLMKYLLANSTDEEEKMYLVNHYLDDFRTTLFRQTMFAEFEHMVHSRLAAGEALTKESLNQIYHDLNVLYYGPDIVVDEEIDREWMRIPHFYTSYYVYQYATGYSAATAFSKKILEEGKPAVDKYINNFLSGGCRKDPIDLLADAGVDMSTPAPVNDALEVFEEYLELLEKHLN